MLLSLKSRKLGSDKMVLALFDVKIHFLGNKELHKTLCSFSKVSSGFRDILESLTFFTPVYKFFKYLVIYIIN